MGPRSGRKLEAPLVENDELLWVVRQLTNPSELGVGMLPSLYLVLGWQAGRPDKVWRAARRLQQKLNLQKVARSVLPAHVLGGCDPTVPRAPMFPRWAPNHFRDPVIHMLQPAGENRNARPSNRSADSRRPATDSPIDNFQDGGSSLELRRISAPTRLGRVSPILVAS